MVKKHIIKTLKEVFDKEYQTKIIDPWDLRIFNTGNQCTIGVFDGFIHWFSLGGGIFQEKVSLSDPQAINIAIEGITHIMQRGSSSND